MDKELLEMNKHDEDSNKIQINSHEFQKIFSKISSWKLSDNFITLTTKTNDNTLYISASCEGGKADIEIKESKEKVSKKKIILLTI